jgi:hypothetical protein
MERGYHDGSGREDSTGRRMVGQRMVENFGNRKALKDATNQMMISFPSHYFPICFIFYSFLHPYLYLFFFFQLYFFSTIPHLSKYLKI